MPEEEKVCQTIKQYYDVSYDAWCSLEKVPMSEVLDLESIQCANKQTTLYEVIDQTKYMIQKGYYNGSQKKFQYALVFESINVVGNKAVANVKLLPIGSELNAYPYFINLGMNVFYLSNKNGQWLIYSHEYDDIEFYEHSTIELYEYNLEEVHARVDRLYGVR